MKTIIAEILQDDDFAQGFEDEDDSPPPIIPGELDNEGNWVVQIGEDEIIRVPERHSLTPSRRGAARRVFERQQLDAQELRNRLSLIPDRRAAARRRLEQFRLEAERMEADQNRRMNGIFDDVENNNDLSQN